MIERSKVQPPRLPEEEVAVSALNDTVLVRGLGFTRAMYYALNIKPNDGQYVAPLLAETVFAADGDPLFTAAEWEAFGAKHTTDVLDLYKAARRLSGLDAEEAEKK